MVTVNRTIYVHPTHYRITDVESIDYISKDLKNMLASWDPVYFKYNYIGFYFDDKNKELRIPRGFPESILRTHYPTHRIEHVKDTTVYEKINIGLLNPPRDYMQEKTLSFMLGASPYEYTARQSQLYVDLDTGSGKTFAGIAAQCMYKVKMLIIIPAISKIGEQWEESLSKFTTLTTPEYLYVKGSEMCMNIMKGKYDKVKTFIIPRSTILAFVRKFNDDWSVLTKLVDKMNVGLKVVDEAHMDFDTIVNIDCYTNVPKTYYMSSSPSRSDVKERIIYNRLFNDIPRYGKKLKSKEQNHIIPLIVFFQSKPSKEQVSKIQTRYGTSLAKYGDYLLDKDGAREEFIDAYAFSLYYLLKFRRDGGKILVICITVEFAKDLQAVTKSMFPYLSSGLFVGSGKDKNKELDNDIIFSTTKSMGTGSEIINHQLTINTLTYASEVTADQVSGRIRQQDNRKGIYCEVVNKLHPAAIKHYTQRLPHLKKKAKDGVVTSHTICDSDISEMYKFINSKYRYTADGMIKTPDGCVKIHRYSKYTS